MEDVTRKRVLRRLEALPPEQLYQVLDFIEFLEAKYAREAARKPDPFQRFAERVEDQMRVRSLAPKAMKGTMRIMSTAGKVLDGVRELGRDIVQGPPGAPGAGPARRPGSSGEGSGGTGSPGQGSPAEAVQGEGYPAQAGDGGESASEAGEVRGNGGSATEREG